MQIARDLILNGLSKNNEFLIGREKFMALCIPEPLTPVAITNSIILLRPAPHAPPVHFPPHLGLPSLYKELFTPLLNQSSSTVQRNTRIQNKNKIINRLQLWSIKLQTLNSLVHLYSLNSCSIQASLKATFLKSLSFTPCLSSLVKEYNYYTNFLF